MLIEELEEGERKGETEILLNELLSSRKDEDHMDKLRKYVNCSGIRNLIVVYELNEGKWIDLISSFLAWIEIYAYGDHCLLGLKVVCEFLNSIHPKYLKLCNMVRSSLVHFVNCLLLDLDEQLKRNELKNEFVRELMFLESSLYFLEINDKFDFNFNSLIKFSLSLDPYDVPLAHTLMTLLHFFHLLPKNLQTNVTFLDCMLDHVNLIHEICPYILHKEYQWINELGFEFRRVFVYFKIEEVDTFRKELLEINRNDLLDDSVKKILKFEDLMYGVGIRYLYKDGIGDGIFRDWICSLMVKMVKVSVGVAAHERYTRPFVECENDLSRILPQPGFVLRDSNLHPGFFRCFGRVIGLAIKHDVHIGYTFDSVMFRQLAGQSIDLENIRDAAPQKYKFYNDILHVYDEGALVEEGYVFLVKFGSDVIDTEKGDEGWVTWEHKEEYVRHSVYLEYVESIKDAVIEIGDGLDDVLSYPSRRLFFQTLTLDDFDLLLRGLSELKLEEWRSHTVYVGYTPTDPEVSWFWECVSEFSEEERLKLFKFWTATRWLPPDGFEELHPKLVIQMAYPTTGENVDMRHPKAQTCSHSLSFPRYTSIEVVTDIQAEVPTG